MMTNILDVQDQVQKFWGVLGINKLKQDTLLPSLVSRDYEGQIKEKGDTVYISEVNPPKATRKQAGSGSDSFASSKVSTTRVALKVDQVITAAYELETLTQLQSQIQSGDSNIRESLMQALEVSLNEYLYSLVNPSTSAPDHVLSGTATMDAAEILAIRKLGAAARWPKDGNWYLLNDPSYFNQILNAATLTSSDYVPDAPVINGQIAMKRFGFNILEDNSDAILSLSPAAAGEKCALAFHKDFMHLALQQEVTFKLSDLHSNKQHGYLLSASVICGAILGCNGNKKHIKIYNT